MEAYIYKAALWCGPCAEKIRADIRLSDYQDGHECEDSDLWPIGPYADGGGEADSPAHCDGCGVFLENDLTSEGRAYVAEAIEDYIRAGAGDAPTITTWADFYGAVITVGARP